MLNLLEIQTLILALNLELLEKAFYTEGLVEFSETDFAMANFTPSSLVRQRYVEILDHETAHVALLSEIFNYLGLKAPQPCQYNLYVFLWNGILGEG